MKILSVVYDNNQYGGCETCDYGAVYVDNIRITWDDGTIITFYSEIYCDVMSESDWMVLLGNASNKYDIIEGWKNKYKSYANDNKEDIWYEVSNVHNNESTRYYLAEILGK